MVVLAGLLGLLVWDLLQLVGRIVGVFDHVAGLIGDGDQIAGAVVGVGLGGLVGIGRRGEPLAGIVLVAGGVAVAVGHRDAVAGIVVGVGEVPPTPETPVRLPRCVVGVGRGVAESVGLAHLATGIVVGVAGGGGVRCAVGLRDRGLAAGKIVDVLGDVSGLVGLGDHVAAEVVGLARRSRIRDKWSGRDG